MEIREDLLHFIWKYKRLQLEDLRTSKNESIIIVDVGTHHHLAGPDFFNAKIKIDGQLWAGNIEIHVKASDWYAHNHEKDPRYANVVLHVVWLKDCEIFGSDNLQVPTLELHEYISPKLLEAYHKLFSTQRKTFVNCEKDLPSVDAFLLDNWLERLYIERLERKSVWVETLLKRHKNDWEHVLFILLLKNFGLKINGEAFLSLAEALNFAIVRKARSDVLQLECIFFGMAHLLEEETIVDTYYRTLQHEFAYYRNKYNLKSLGVRPPEFFKLRPMNFPTIRLSQLAQLYGSRETLFSTLMEAKSIETLYAIFEVAASPYWNTHFTFGKESKKSVKKLSKRFIDLLIINTVLPLQFCHARHLGIGANERIIKIIAQIPLEQNNIVLNFRRIGMPMANAREGQAALQLYSEYCTKNKCLQCAVGNSLLKA